MRYGLCLALLAFCPFAFGVNCPKDQPRDGSALLQIERTWAKALEVNDLDVVGCLLADEFQDADVHGDLHNRGETLAHVSERKRSHNDLSEMEPHVQGEFAYVRGLNTVTDARGKIAAKVRFTDIFMYRDGRWVAVAGQETLLSQPAR